MDEDNAIPQPPPAPPVPTPDAVREGEPSDKGGDITKKIENIENNINLVLVVVGVGFTAIAVTIILFAFSAYNERTTSYDQLLNKVDKLQAEIEYSNGQ
jgi:hypothetical protein